MKKLVMMLGVISGLTLLSACGKSQAATEVSSQTTKTTAKMTTTSEVASEATASTFENERSSLSESSTASSSVGESMETESSEKETSNHSTTQAQPADTTSSEMESEFTNGQRSDLDQEVPADLLNSYRTFIAQAGLNGATYDKEQLLNYYQAGVQFGDVQSLLQLVAQDQGASYTDLLTNYYRYNGKNADGSLAQLPADTLQAYQTAISQAGLDSNNFSVEQLTSYYRESHLTGDYGTLLRLIARDQGLNADQLIATYDQNNK